MSDILVLREFRNYIHITCEFSVQRMTSTPVTSYDMQNIYYCTVSVLAVVIIACQETEKTSWTRRVHFLVTCICHTIEPRNLRVPQTLQTLWHLTWGCHCLTLMTWPVLTSRHGVNMPENSNLQTWLVSKTRLPPFRKYMLSAKMSPVVKKSAHEVVEIKILYVY